MVVQRLWNFVKRHRKKFIASGIIMGGVYYALRVYLPRVQQRLLEGLLKELAEGASSSDSQAEQQQARVRFQKHQQVSDDYARKGLRAYLPRHAGCFKVEACQAKVKAAADKEAKLAAFKDLQVECLSLVASAVYSLHVILLLHRVQFNLAGREVAAQPQDGRTGAVQDSKANGEEASSSMQELIDSTEYFLEKGPGMMSAAARKAVQDAIAAGPLLPDTSVNSESLSAFFKQVFDKMEQDVWGGSKGSALLPPEGAANVQRVQVKHLLDEARDYLESPHVVQVFRSTIHTAADRLPVQLAAFGGKASALKDSSVLLAVLFGSCVSLATSLLTDADGNGDETPTEVTIRSFADQIVVTQFCEGLYFQEPTTKK
ncbi:PEX3 [Symbiodinium natans]|uniref:PEX3 protein n=1 Tax=Symbiodinium natans TaxID=878477 RepID=A0A812UYJ2_9DINO|nr:PEX3 [Symbiodinium natans]